MEKWRKSGCTIKSHRWSPIVMKRSTFIILLITGACVAAQNGLNSNEVTSAYGAVCDATDVMVASSTQQIVDAIKAYSSTTDEQPVYIRATHQHYHSTASFPCAAATAGQDQQPGTGNPKAKTVSLLMQDMNKLIAVNSVSQTITIQAGATVTELIHAAKSAGLQVPLMSLPNYGGLTLGGIIATAATGTGAAGTPSTVCDILLSLQWVDGYGQIHSSERRSVEGKAICGGLGVVGVITEITLQLEDAGKVFVETRARLQDTALADDITNMLQLTPHVTVTWRPDLGKYTAYMFSRSNSSEAINATIYQVDRPATDIAILSQALKDWQNDIYTLNPLLNALMCGIIAPKSSIDIHWAMDVATQRNGLQYALADGNDILSSVCNGGPDGSCSFTTVGHIGVGDIHFTIDQSHLGQWIADVKEVIAEDLKGKQDKNCLPPGYFWLRFGNPTEDYVGLNTAPYKQPVHVQLSLFRNREPGVAPMKNQHVLTILEQLTLCSYNGRPHFGKNYGRTFTYSKCPLAGRYPQWTSWLATAQKHDPKGLFASPLIQTLLTNGSYKAFPGCGVAGQCFCDTDEHCLIQGKPASQGWKCVASKAFPQYKACRPTLS